MGFAQRTDSATEQTVKLSYQCSRKLRDRRARAMTSFLGWLLGRPLPDREWSQFIERTDAHPIHQGPVIGEGER